MLRRRAIFAPSGRTLFFGKPRLEGRCRLPTSHGQITRSVESSELLNCHAFGLKGPAAICDLGTFPHVAAAWDLNVENDLNVEITGREPLGKARLNRTFEAIG